MKVTANTVFHFTSTLDKLKQILSERFRLTYCHEIYHLNYETHDSYFPMVSFCDMPLSLAGDQIEQYGPYGIGMTKEWAERISLSPVLYVEKNSSLANDIQSALDDSVELAKELHEALPMLSEAMGGFSKEDLETELEALKNGDIQQKAAIAQRIQNLLQPLTGKSKLIDHYNSLIKILNKIYSSNLNLFRHIKNYRGELIRKGKIQEPNYRFYDEREWRYIPEINDGRVSNYPTRDEYKKFREGRVDKPFIDGINLPFAVDDINYLLVANTSDIPMLITHLRGCGIASNQDQLDILSTKIFTLEQIEADF